MDLPEFPRFWNKVAITGKDDCWEWQAGKFAERGGYGQFSWRLKPCYAHRVAWEICFGPPGDLCVLHKCDNPLCVNPSHLWLGTRDDNVQDMQAKGRANKPGAPGVRNTNAKLMDADIPLIRSLYATGAMSQYEIAECFGVRQSTIKRIINGQAWTHIS